MVWVWPQLILEPQADSAWYGGGSISDVLPEAIWSGELDAQYISYFKVIIPGQPMTQRTYVFLRSDDPVVVKVITKAQFVAIAGTGPGQFTP